MSIELIPRAKEVDRWSKPAHSWRGTVRAAEWSSEAGGTRIPLDPRPFWSRHAGLGAAWIVIFVPVSTRIWLHWWVIPVLVAVAVLVAARAARLPRLQGRSDPHLVLRPDGVAVDGIVVPWGQVESVRRLRFGQGDSAADYLAIHVHDFVGVSGLSPFHAGLANLTRRRLVVLAETRELAEPEALARALDHLVAHPPDRALLDSEAGAHLVRAA